MNARLRGVPFELVEAGIHAHLPLANNFWGYLRRRLRFLLLLWRCWLNRCRWLRLLNLLWKRDVGLFLLRFFLRLNLLFNRFGRRVMDRIDLILRIANRKIEVYDFSSRRGIGKVGLLE